MDLAEYKGKRIQLFLRGARGERLVFNGEIIEDGKDLIKFKDKFGDTLVFNKSQILEISLINGGRQQ